MNDIIKIMISQLTNGQGISALSALTGAQIVYNNKNNSINIVFRRQVGKKGQKLNNLYVKYDISSDFYIVECFKISKNATFELTKKYDDVFCDQLKSIAEEVTGLYFSF